MVIVAAKFLLNVVTSNFNRQGSESHGRTTCQTKNVYFFSCILSQVLGTTCGACAQSCVGS